jgi:hypothetical protein
MQMRIERDRNDMSGRFEVTAGPGELGQMEQVLQDVRAKYPTIALDGESEAAEPAPPEEPAPGGLDGVEITR